MKQTAVEWYAIEMAEYLRSIYGDGIINLDILKQAKEMEKERMIEFGYACTNQIEMNEAGELLMVKSPEELYTQVYGGDK